MGGQEVSATRPKTRPLRGFSLVAGRQLTNGDRKFAALDPRRGVELAPSFIAANAEAIERAASAAAVAAPEWAASSGKTRGALLERIARKLEAAMAALVDRAELETGLPRARLEAEVARTCWQLRLYGATACEGHWVDARIETGDPTRQPLPKHDHRSFRRAIGPVVVFGASNFPFAYSVAGGDTASALAAGCPVIVKAHPAHPGVSELVGRIITAAVAELKLPQGIFSLLMDAQVEVGVALVKHPKIKAVGFTGSLRGGRALADLAAARPEPIPVYAEMGSINPIFILPGALAERRAEIVQGLLQSATVGVGQMCTNPGVVVMLRTPASTDFLREFRHRLEEYSGGVMLHAGIAQAYKRGTEARARLTGVEPLVRRGAEGSCAVAAQWFETEAAVFLVTPELHEEIFGPSGLVVWCERRDEVLEVARRIRGSLTASIHAGKSDRYLSNRLATLLPEFAGRVVWNGYPTGLEVTTGVVHGGPYPATSDGGRSTSVGPRALERWTRLICYQNYPARLLPSELRDENPLSIWRQVNGRHQREPIIV